MSDFVNYELIEMTGKKPEDNEFQKVVIEENGDFTTAYFYNGNWYSGETQDGWFNRVIKNVSRWFEIRERNEYCSCPKNDLVDLVMFCSNCGRKVPQNKHMNKE